MYTSHITIKLYYIVEVITGATIRERERERKLNTF